MKKLIVLILIISGCIKDRQQVSDEVTVSVLNQCTATRYFYDNTGAQYAKDIFDCNYVTVLTMKIAPGTYTIKAETLEGKSVTKTFKKGLYGQSLVIEF